jgi:hypothetical protein
MLGDEKQNKDSLAAIINSGGDIRNCLEKNDDQIHPSIKI